MRHLYLVAKNSLGHGLNILIGLGFAICGARLLSLEDYGELRTAMTILPLLMAFSLPGYDSIILRSASLNKPVSLLRQFCERVLGAVLGSLLLLLGILFFKERLSETLFFFLVVIAILLPLFETGTGFRNFLIGSRLRQKALTIVLRTRLFSLFLFTAMTCAIYLLKISPVAILPAYMLSIIAPTLITFIPVARRQRTNASSLTNQHFRAAIGATMASLAYTFAFSVDKLWLRHEVGAAALASYSVLVMVPQEGSRLFDAMIPLFYRSLFYGKDATEKRKLFFSVFFVPVAAGLYVVAFYYLSPFVFGEVYRYDFLSVALSGLLMCGISFEFYCSHALFAREGARKLLIFTLASLLVTLPVVYFSLAFGGIKGLLAGLILKQFAVPLAFLVVLRKKYP